MIESRIVYFEEGEPEATEITLALVRARLASSAVRTVVLASTTGATARKAAAVCGDAARLVVVPHQHGFRRPVSLFPPELAQELATAGHAVHFGTMLFHTGGFYGTEAPTAMANLLRCFGQGVKVCFEIVLMAADAGLVGIGEEVLALAGTGRGADTALVVRAGCTQDLKKLKVREILCKPRDPITVDEVRARLAREEESRQGKPL